LSTTKSKGVSDETLANSIKRSINEAPNKKGGEMKEGKKEGKKREREERENTQVQAKRMEPKVRHNGVNDETLANSIKRSINEAPNLGKLH
jgi:hypothetical protein